jgi:UDPglucose 6-dehydrogenase
VPTDEAGSSNLAPLRALIDTTASAAGPDATLVVMSQAPPGFCRGLAARLPATLRLFYQVETLVFGNAVERAIRPERYIVGCAGAKSGLPECYRRYLEAFGCPVLAMRYESAELCKIAINCFLVSSISTTNMFAEICEKIHADWSEIVPALRLDRRIGPYAYLNPGLGISGGNLERDLVTVENLAAEYGADARAVTAWLQSSSQRKDWALRLLLDRGFLNRGRETQVAIWGIAYKPETHSTKNSPSLALIRALQRYRLRTYDPAVRINHEEFPDVQSCDSPLEAAEGADVLVIMTPWKEFAEVLLPEVKRKMQGSRVVDPFMALDEGSCRRLGFDYYRLGV